MQIKTVGVIGSGVMGGGIAAQLANAGFDVVLLDIVPANAADRSAIAKGAVERMLKTDPAPFMLPEFAARIKTGNLEDDLNLLSSCDWIIEVVLERLDIKHATYAKIRAHARPDAIISSNTSTIPLADLVRDQGDDFAGRFLITHFFNPPRYMRLLELIVGEQTRADVVDTVREVCDVRLGKGVVLCNDRPGFIANRIGTFWLTRAINTAIENKVPVPVADAVMGKPSGVPKTAVFGLLDLIGIDLMPHLSHSLLSTLPKTDAYCTIYRDLPLITDMIAAGYTGRKGKGGFYRMDAKRKKQVLSDLSAPFGEDAYAPAADAKIASVEAGKKGLRAVMETDDIGGQYAWAVWRDTLHYALTLVPEIAPSIADVDAAMKMGYNWKMGPFEMVDAIGPKWFADRLRTENLSVPALLEQVADGTFYRTENGVLEVMDTNGTYAPVPRAKGVELLSDVKRRSKPVIKKASASVWDTGDGVLCLEFTGKMNTLDDSVFEAIHETIATIESDPQTYKGLVIHNESDTFSAGANLGLAMFAINTAMWSQIESLIENGQAAYRALKFAPFPVVAAPTGLALGGGCEILLHSDAIQAHAETYCGLVEVGVGIIPGWGGCKEMLLRATNTKTAGGPMPAVKRAFETIAMATVAKSAFDAKKIGYLRAGDDITMNRDRLLFDAKQKVLALAQNYAAPVEQSIALPGPSGKLALMMAVSDLQKSGKATPHDTVVCEALATVLSGGPDADPSAPISEDTILELERTAFMQLTRHPDTHARIEHMLDTGKPLRN